MVSCFTPMSMKWGVAGATKWNHESWMRWRVLRHSWNIIAKISLYTNILRIKSQHDLMSKYYSKQFHLWLWFSCLTRSYSLQTCLGWRWQPGQPLTFGPCPNNNKLNSPPFPVFYLMTNECHLAIQMKRHQSIQIKDRKNLCTITCGNCHSIKTVAVPGSESNSYCKNILELNIQLQKHVWSINQFIHICVCVCLSLYLSWFVSVFFTWSCLVLSYPVYLSIYLSICLSIFLSIYLASSIYLANACTYMYI